MAGWETREPLQIQLNKYNQYFAPTAMYVCDVQLSLNFIGWAVMLLYNARHASPLFGLSISSLMQRTI